MKICDEREFVAIGVCVQFEVDGKKITLRSLRARRPLRRGRAQGGIAVLRREEKPKNTG